MKEANQKLQHEMSSVHQTLNSEAKVLERYLQKFQWAGVGLVYKGKRFLHHIGQ